MKKEGNISGFTTNAEMVEIYVVNKTESTRQQGLNKYIKSILKSLRTMVRRGYTSMGLVSMNKMINEDSEYVKEALISLGYEVQNSEEEGWSIHIVGV